MLSANDVITERIYKKNTETNVMTGSVKTVINLCRKQDKIIYTFLLFVSEVARPCTEKRGKKVFARVTELLYLFFFLPLQICLVLIT